LDAVKKIHAEQNLDYTFPDISSPLFLVKKVREVNGLVVAACFLRITAETFLVTAGSPVEKGRAIEELQPDVLLEAYEKGLSDIICAVPPEISESFAPALTHLGWERTRDWPIWQRDLI
jgi:hypothetical protein